MTFLLMATCALIVFGLAYLIALTSGPFNVFGLMRTKIKESASAKMWIKEGISCPICISFWVGIPVAACLASDVATGVQLWLTSFGFVCVVVSLSPD